MSDAASVAPTGQTKYRVLWPLILLLVAEVAAFSLAAAVGSLPVTRFSLTVALGALLTGLIPALLRPNTTTLLAGGLAIIGASFLVAPFDFDELPRLAGSPTAASVLPALVILRLVNAAVLGPLALHLTARFPKRSALADRHLVAIYGVTAGLLITLFLMSPGPRLAVAIGALLWLVALLAACVLQLFFASRDPSSTQETQRPCSAAAGRAPCRLRRRAQAVGWN